MNKKNYAFPIILTIVVVLLLSVLGGVIFMIANKLSDTSDKKSRDDDEDDEEKTSEEISVEEEETVPLENVVETAAEFDEVEKPTVVKPSKRPGKKPIINKDETPDATSDVTAYETTVAITDETEVVENIPEVVYEDGSKDVYSYDENGNVIELFYYNADGALESRTVYGYSADGDLNVEKRYNAGGSLVYEGVINADGSVSITEREYGANGKMTGGKKHVFTPEGVASEYHTLNAYGDVIYTEYYNENGEFKYSREYHFTSSGYSDGYTETNALGKSTRYNNDGTVRVATPKPATTTAATTTAATTVATTAAPKPAEPEIYTEQTVVGSDKVVKYYNVASDGTKTLSNTITYRTINGKEVIITNVDEIRGYGRQNEYDANGNLSWYMTYNVTYGRRTYVVYHDLSGNVTESRTYEYDESGRRTRENLFDAAGNSNGYITYEYIPKNDGTYKTKISTYNSLGTLESSVVR